MCCAAHTPRTIQIGLRGLAAFTSTHVEIPQLLRSTTAAVPQAAPRRPNLGWSLVLYYCCCARTSAASRWKNANSIKNKKCYHSRAALQEHAKQITAVLLYKIISCWHGKEQRLVIHARLSIYYSNDSLVVRLCIAVYHGRYRFNNTGQRR